MPIVKVMVEVADLPLEENIQGLKPRDWVDVRADIDIAEMKNAVDDMSDEDRRDYVRGLVRDWNLGSPVEDEVFRIYDRIRFGGFDEGSALEVLSRLVNLIEDDRAQNGWRR